MNHHGIIASNFGEIMKNIMFLKKELIGLEGDKIDSEKVEFMIDGFCINDQFLSEKIMILSHLVVLYMNGKAYSGKHVDSLNYLESIVKKIKYRKSHKNLTIKIEKLKQKISDNEQAPPYQNLKNYHRKDRVRNRLYRKLTCMENNLKFYARYIKT